MTSKVKRRVSELLRGKAKTRRGTEQDVEHDEHQALRRPVGGEGEDSSTTGTGASGEFVGRVAGEDPAEEENR